MFISGKGKGQNRDISINQDFRLDESIKVVKGLPTLNTPKKTAVTFMGRRTSIERKEGLEQSLSREDSNQKEIFDSLKEISSPNDPQSSWRIKESNNFSLNEPYSIKKRILQNSTTFRRGAAAREYRPIYIKEHKVSLRRNKEQQKKQ